MRIRSEDEVGQLAKRFKALSENLLTLIRNAGQVRPVESGSKEIVGKKKTTPSQKGGKLLPNPA